MCNRPAAKHNMSFYHQTVLEPPFFISYVSLQIWSSDSLKLNSKKGCNRWIKTDLSHQTITLSHKSHNMSYWGTNKSQLLKGNMPLYTRNEKWKETPLSIKIMEARWKLFGRILERDVEIPANKAMNYH